MQGIEWNIKKSWWFSHNREDITNTPPDAVKVYWGWQSGTEAARRRSWGVRAGTDRLSPAEPRTPRTSGVSPLIQTPPTRRGTTFSICFGPTDPFFWKLAQFIYFERLNCEFSGALKLRASGVVHRMSRSVCVQNLKACCMRRAANMRAGWNRWTRAQHAGWVSQCCLLL